MTLNQSRFFDSLFELVQKQNKQLQALHENLEEKVSKEKLLKALEMKANRKDVTAGFDKLRLYIDNVKNEDKIEYVTKEEIGELINEHLLLDGNQKYSTSDYQQKLNMIAYEKLLDRKLEDKMSNDDVEVLFEKKILNYVKRDELRGLKEHIDNLCERVDNNEVETNVKVSELSEKFDDVSYDVRLKTENLHKEYTNAQFVKKSDIEFLDRETFGDLIADVDSLKKTQMAENFDLLFKKTRKLDDSIKKLDKDFDYSLGKLKADNEKIINELKFDVITYKSDVLSEFSKVHKTIGASQPVQEESNFDIKIDKVFKHLNLMEENVKNLESELQNKTSGLNKSIEDVKAGSDKCKKVNNHIQVEIADLKKLVNTKFNSISELDDALNKLKMENAQRFKEFDLELKGMKLCAKESSLPNKRSAMDDFETYVLERLSKLEKGAKERDLSPPKKQLLSTLKNMPDRGANNLDEVKQLKTLIDQKADTEAVCKILDEKADIEEVNKLLTDLHNEIDNIPSQFTLPKKSMESKPKSLAAMWLWKSGLLISDQKIPWEFEQHNTGPSDFTLHKNKYEIIVSNKGLYEVTFGFFGPKKPKVEMVVNGEIVVNSVKMKFNENTDKLANRNQDVNTAGLTYYDFLMLPDDTRVYFNFEGTKRCEGFIRFKRFK